MSTLTLLRHRITRELMDPDTPPASEREREVWKFVSIIRDGLLAVVGTLLAWSVYQIHDLSLDVAALKANHVTQQEHAALASSMASGLAEASRSREESFRTIQGQLTQVLSELGQIKGANEVMKAQQQQDRRR